MAYAAGNRAGYANAASTGWVEVAGRLGVRFRTAHPSVYIPPPILQAFRNPAFHDFSDFPKF